MIDNKAIGGLLAILAALVVAATLSTTPQTSTPASTTTSSTTTTQPAPTSDGRPWGEAATWNRPVAELGEHPRSADFAARLFNFGRVSTLATYFDEWSYPVYSVSTATTSRRVWRAGYGHQGSIANGSSIPWNPAWKIPDDNDRIVILVDPPTGREWDLWLVQDVNMTPCLTLENLLAGFDLSQPNLCVGQADIIQDERGVPVDRRTATSTYPIGGAWMQSGIGLVTPREVEAGEIRHALNMIIPNTMFGPQCTPVQRATEAFGSTCGHWLNPASRLEWSSAPQQCGTNTIPNTEAGRRTTVPEGARVFVRKTEAQIEAWLDRRQFTGQLRRTARIFAVVLREYGAFVENTSCYESGVFTTGRIGFDRDAWNALGIPADRTVARHILDGLIESPADLGIAGESAPMVVGSITRR